MYSVYVLIDPRSDDVRYIGVTKDVYARFSQHLQCNGSNPEKNAWIQELKASNLMLIMRTIEIANTLENAREREQYWIHQYLSQGAHLFNIDITRAFTYEDFLAKMGKPVAKKKRAPRIELPAARGQAAKRTMQFFRRNPKIGPSELARRAQISRSYASRILAAQVASK
jgi:predicted GIY-YIG superfamily endonuclease